MYAKHTVTIADTTLTNYTVTADELHIFIADTIKRCGGINYQSDVLLDYENMLHRMKDKGGYMWSIRATGTWFMPVMTYAAKQPDMFTTPISSMTCISGIPIAMIRNLWTCMDAIATRKHAHMPIVVTSC